MTSSSYRDLFLLPEDVHYLNCAYMSPLLKKGEEAGIRGMRGKATPHLITPEDFFTDSGEVRKQFSRIIDNDDPHRVVILPAVSYGMAVVARNIPCEAGQKIVLVEEQFPSNYYAWERLADDKGLEIITVTAPDSDRNRGEKWNEMLLESISEDTCLVALPHVHWADGTRFDLKAVREKTRKVGSWMVVDGTQSVGALPFSVREFQPDALVCAAYKWLMGPYSTALAWLGPALDGGVPLEENWINRYESRYQPGALRYEVGEHSNFILVPMLLEGLKQINEWGVENVQKYDRELLRPFIGEFKELGFNLEESEFRGHHLFGLRKSGLDAAALGRHLQRENISISVRGNSIRVSLHFWNDSRDLEKLLKVLRA